MLPSCSPAAATQAHRLALSGVEAGIEGASLALRPAEWCGGREEASREPVRLKPQGTAVELTLPGPVRLSTAGHRGQPACLGSAGVASILCSPSLPLRMSQSEEGRLFHFHVGFPFSQSAGSGLPDWRVSGGVPRPTQVFKTISRGSLRPSGFHNTKRLPAFSTVLAFAPMVRKRWWAKRWHLWRHPASGPRLPCGRPSPPPTRS